MSKQSQELDLSDNPQVAFETWLKDAIDAQCAEPTAMTLATASKSGVPSARIVLFKGFKEGSFKFFTNFKSPKADDLIENPRAALVFFWSTSSFQRQVRIFGMVEKLSERESIEYFRTRERGSQIGAWASPQSQKVASRAALEKMVSDIEQKFAGKPIVQPPFWGGFALSPQSFEFWEGREFRIHDRFIFERKNSAWIKSRLAP